LKSPFLEKLNYISTFVFDIDGVLTDGTVFVMDSGELIRRMNVKDGYALQLAVKKNYHIAIISGGTHNGVVKRLNGLGVTDVYMGCSNKLEIFNEYIKKNKIKVEETLYMADDIPDYEVFQKAGLKTCPANAVPEIYSMADYVSPFNGGDGCVRDIIEKVLKVQGKWMDGLDAHIW